jgi:hypothetical protein
LPGRFYPHTGNVYVGDFELGMLSGFESQPPDRQGVGERRDGDVHVDTTVQGGDGLPVERGPVALPIGAEPYGGAVNSQQGHARLAHSPPGVAANLIPDTEPKIALHTDDDPVGANAFLVARQR